MNYLPFASLIIYLAIWGLISSGTIPDPSSIVQLSKEINSNYLLLLMGVIIFLESIIYVGFYLPGQFIAVLIIVGGAQQFTDIIPLTIVSIGAVTLGAGVNYAIGSILRTKGKNITKIDYKKILLSMIHINTIALALFDAGRDNYSKWIIPIVGLLNLPYYLLLITLTYLYKDIVIQIGENPYYLLIALIIWCIYSLFKYKSELSKNNESYIK